MYRRQPTQLEVAAAEVVLAGEIAVAVVVEMVEVVAAVAEVTPVPPDLLGHRTHILKGTLPT